MSGLSAEGWVGQDRVGPVLQGCVPVSHPHSLIKALNYFFGFHGRSDAMTANPELCLIAVPVWTAFGQSGVKTRPFSPTLPVMDNRALFLMASEKVSWVHGKETERMCSVTLFCFFNKIGHNKHQDINIRHLHFFCILLVM